MPQGTLKEEAKTVECIIPILNVANLQASIDFYDDVPGFKTDWKAGSTASVSRDGRAIMLCQQDQGHAGAASLQRPVPSHASSSSSVSSQSSVSSNGSASSSSSETAYPEPYKV